MSRPGGHQGPAGNRKVEVQKPFAQEEELATKSARLEELNTLLNMDQRDSEMAEPSAEEMEEQNERNAPRRSRGWSVNMSGTQ